MYLFFDTETTGLHANAEIAQFAMLLYDDKQKIVGQFKSLVKPDGWTMPEETAKFHGITQEICEKYGTSINGIFGLFGRWCEKAEILIAHNISFDLGRLHYTSARLNLPLSLPHKRFCTMGEATDICKIPPTQKMIDCGMGDKFKSPNLKEAYKHFMGSDFEGAHDALADVKACADVFFKIEDSKTIAQKVRDKIADDPAYVISAG